MQQTEFSLWCKRFFGGKGTSNDARSYAERFLYENVDSDRPPVNLRKLALAIGFTDPKVVYKDINGDGGLEIIESKMRIIFNSNLAPDGKLNIAKISRMRFTYAHELGHAILWDLNSGPPKRIAPKDDSRKEEQICNGIACGFLMPKAMLRMLLDEEKYNIYKYNSYRVAAKKIGVSISALLYGIEEIISESIQIDRFIMLSAISKNRGQSGVNKPRCIQCIIHKDKMKYGKALFAAYEGLDSAKAVMPDKMKWSIEEYYNEMAYIKAEKYIAEERIKIRDNRVVELYDMKHEKVDKTGYVWSTGKYKIIGS
jgi:Zn-dependent peptidase ImmA (M78 family)